MKDWRITSIIVVIVLAVGGAAILRPNDDPEILRSLSGCYRTANPDALIAFRVDRTGWLITEGDRTRVKGYATKNGDALLPEKLIVFDRYKPRIEFDARSPLIIRASADHRTLIVLDDRTGGEVIFDRVPCARATV